MGLAEHSDIIETIASKHRPKLVVEVGIKYSTTRLLSIFSKHGMERYVGIDPVFRYQCPADYSHCFKQIGGYSLEELPKLGKIDLVMLDGDHTYFTVLKELELLDKILDPGAVVLLHDVEEPWARKDLYYDESKIPPEYVNGEKQGVLTALEDFLAEHGSKYSEPEMHKGNNGLAYLVKYA